MQVRRQSRFHPDTLNLLRRAAIGAALFLLVMTALAIKGHAQHLIRTSPPPQPSPSGGARFQTEQAEVCRTFWEVKAMLDVLFIAITILFFLIALAYVRGCEKLQ
jgi:hypothetical protein